MSRPPCVVSCLSSVNRPHYILIALPNVPRVLSIGETDTALNYINGKAENKSEARVKMSTKYELLSTNGSVNASGDDALIQLQPTNAYAVGGGGAAAGKRAASLGDTAFLGSGEDSPSYRVLAELLTSDYRLTSARELNIIQAKATRMQNLCSCICCFCGVRTFEVKNGCIRSVQTNPLSNRECARGH